MTNEEIVGLVGNGVFNQHDFGVLAEHMKEDYIQHNPLVPQGREGFQGFFEDAAIHLHRADRIDPDNSQVLGLLGLTYLRRRRPDVASELLARAVELEPDNRMLYSGYLNTLAVEAIRRFRRGDAEMSRQMLEFLVEQGLSDATLLAVLDPRRHG